MYEVLTTLVLTALTVHVSANLPRHVLDDRSQAQGTLSPAASSSASQAAASSSVFPSGSPAVGDLNQSVDITIDGKVFPPAVLTKGVVIPQDFSVNCINCIISGNISVSAGGGVGDDMIEPPTVFQAAGADPQFDFSDLWVGAIIDNMTAHFEFAINLTASNGSNEFVAPLYSYSKTESFGDVITVTATFSPELHGWVNTTTNVNFTHGFDFEMQPGSGLLIPIEHLPESRLYHFNDSTLTPLPYTSTTGDINMTMEISFRPKFDFLITAAGGLAAGTEISAYLDVPKLDVQVLQVLNVTSSCDPASPSLPTDQVFKNLTNIIPSIGFDASVVFTATEFTDQQSSPPYLESWTAKNLSTSCLEYDVAAKTLGPAAQAKPSKSAAGTASGHHASLSGILIAMIIVSISNSVNGH